MARLQGHKRQQKSQIVCSFLSLLDDILKIPTFQSLSVPIPQGQKIREEHLGFCGWHSSYVVCLAHFGHKLHDVNLLLASAEQFYSQ